MGGLTSSASSGSAAASPITLPIYQRIVSSLRYSVRHTPISQGHRCAAIRPIRSTGCRCLRESRAKIAISGCRFTVISRSGVPVLTRQLALPGGLLLVSPANSGTAGRVSRATSPFG